MFKVVKKGTDYYIKVKSAINYSKKQYFKRYCFTKTKQEFTIGIVQERYVRVECGDTIHIEQLVNGRYYKEVNKILEFIKLNITKCTKCGHNDLLPDEDCEKCTLCGCDNMIVGQGYYANTQKMYSKSTDIDTKTQDTISKLLEHIEQLESKCLKNNFPLIKDSVCCCGELFYYSPDEGLRNQDNDMIICDSEIDNDITLECIINFLQQIYKEYQNIIKS